MLVLPADGGGFHDLAQRIAVGGRRIGPVSPDRIPDVAQPLFVGIAILGNDCRHPLRVLHHDAEADGCSDIESVEGKSFDAQHLNEPLDDVGKIVERVGEIFARGRLRLAEPRYVGRDKVKSVGEQRKRDRGTCGSKTEIRAAITGSVWLVLRPADKILRDRRYQRGDRWYASCRSSPLETEIAETGVLAVLAIGQCYLFGITAIPAIVGKPNPLCCGSR